VLVATLPKGWSRPIKASDVGSLFPRVGSVTWPTAGMAAGGSASGPVVALVTSVRTSAASPDALGGPIADPQPHPSGDTRPSPVRGSRTVRGDHLDRRVPRRHSRHSLDVVGGRTQPWRVRASG